MDILGVRKSNENLYLHRLDVDRIVEVAEEEFDLFFYDNWSFLENQIDVFQCNIYDFWLHVQ